MKLLLLLAISLQLFSMEIVIDSELSKEEYDLLTYEVFGKERELAAKLAAKLLEEKAAWDEIKDRKKYWYFKSFLNTYPNGKYAKLAELNFEKYKTSSHISIEEARENGVPSPPLVIIKGKTETIESTDGTYKTLTEIIEVGKTDYKVKTTMSASGYEMTSQYLYSKKTGTFLEEISKAPVMVVKTEGATWPQGLLKEGVSWEVVTLFDNVKNSVENKVLGFERVNERDCIIIEQEADLTSDYFSTNTTSKLYYDYNEGVTVRTYTEATTSTPAMTYNLVSVEYK